MKAILYKKTSKDIVQIIENITSYDELGYKSDSINVEGLNPNIQILMVDDDVGIEAKTIEELKTFNIKPQEDYKKKLSALRKKRNQLLTETDYLILPDYPILEEKKESIKAYRQELRDITENITIDNIDSIKFPEEV